jgi:hypothetical protein
MVLSWRPCRLGARGGGPLGRAGRRRHCSGRGMVGGHRLGCRPCVGPHRSRELQVGRRPSTPVAASAGKAECGRGCVKTLEECVLFESRPLRSRQDQRTRRREWFGHPRKHRLRAFPHSLGHNQPLTWSGRIRSTAELRGFDSLILVIGKFGRKY